MTANRPAAVLWDMDGTIVDTEPLWMRAETELVESFDGTWSQEQGLQLVGRGLFSSASILIAAGVRMEPIEVVHHLTGRVQELLREGEPPWRPGARELLTGLAEAGVPAALVTMSFRVMAEQIAGELGFEAFAAVVTGDDPVRHKPDPEPYTHAAQLLGVPIGSCVAIEDSVSGIASAVASGAAAIAVPFHVPLPPSPAYATWDTLAGRGIPDLAEVLDAHRRREATP